MKTQIAQIENSKLSRFAGSTIFLYIMIQNDKSGQAPNSKQKSITEILMTQIIGIQITQIIRRMGETETRRMGETKTRRMGEQ